MPRPHAGGVRAPTSTETQEAGAALADFAGGARQIFGVWINFTGFFRDVEFPPPLMLCENAAVASRRRPANVPEENKRKTQPQQNFQILMVRHSKKKSQKLPKTRFQWQSTQMKADLN